MDMRKKDILENISKENPEQSGTKTGDRGQ